MNGQKLQINQGQRFGMFTIVSERPRLKLPSGQYNRVFLCKCECGKEKEVRLLHLTRGRIRSCGCLGAERHGETASQLYTIWRGMKNRRDGEKYIDRHRYKDRGINVCKEWSQSFMVFRNWAMANSYKPGLQIDRINNNGNYAPDNCRFVNVIINVNNREVTFMVNYNGENISLKLLLRKKNILKSYDPIYRRIKRGWPAQKAIDTPIKEGNYKRKKHPSITKRSTENF